MMLTQQEYGHLFGCILSVMMHSLDIPARTGPVFINYLHDFVFCRRARVQIHQIVSQKSHMKPMTGRSHYKIPSSFKTALTQSKGEEDSTCYYNLEPKCHGSMLHTYWRWYRAKVIPVTRNTLHCIR